MSKIVSAFCGTGKTYLCKNNKNFVERECWKFDKKDFPKNYVESIMSAIVDNDYVFISTNKIALDCLQTKNKDVVIFYPEIGLKQHYMKRYKERGSHSDFIETLDKHWDDWITELNRRNDFKKYKMKKGEYLADYVFGGVAESGLSQPT